MKLMDLTAEVTNSFTQLPNEHRSHQNDVEDVFFHIRSVQSIILSRAGMRQYLQQYEQAPTTDPTNETSHASGRNEGQ